MNSFSDVIVVELLLEKFKRNSKRNCANKICRFLFALGIRDVGIAFITSREAS